MKRIPHTSVKAWGSVSGKRFPSGISLLCPHCSQLGIFTPRSHLVDAQRGAISASASCPACQNHVGFWGVNECGEECHDIFFHPDNNDYHEIIEETDDLPEPLVRAYVSSVDAYNSGNFPATAVCCRRTLEGIFKYLLSEEKRGLKLAAAIAAAAEDNDFSKPIKELAHVLRKGGNLGAHFDMETEPDEHVAKAMIELLEYLISYLYTLPQKIGQLETELNNA